MHSLVLIPKYCIEKSKLTLHRESTIPTEMANTNRLTHVITGDLP